MMTPSTDLKPADPGRFFTKVLADQHYQKGVDLERAGDWQQALRNYRRASSLDPTNVLFLLARGHVCQINHLEPEAEGCYERVLELRPGHTVALYNQAQLHAARGELDAARVALASIAAGNLDSLGDRAAPVFCRLGDLALRRQEYATAAIHFRRALDFAPGHPYATASLDGLDRFAEFAAPFAEDGRVPPKIALYGYAGAVVLGFPDDNGIDIPAYPNLGFDSLDELARTLARLVALMRRHRQTFDVVVALDPDSQALCVALAGVLGARAIHTADGTPDGATALGVTATGAGLFARDSGAAMLMARCPDAVRYAVGLAKPVWEYAFAPHVVSLSVFLEFPWNRKEASAAEHAEAYGEALRECLRQATPDATTDSQLAWYRAHHRLAAALVPWMNTPASQHFLYG